MNECDKEQKSTRDKIAKTMLMIKQALEDCTDPHDEYHLKNSLHAIRELNHKELKYKEQYRLCVFWNLGLEDLHLSYAEVVVMCGLPGEVVIGEELVYERSLTHPTTQQRVRRYLESKYGFIVDFFSQIN